MVDVTYVRKSGGLLLARLSDGTETQLFATSGDLWVRGGSAPAEPPPPPPPDPEPDPDPPPSTGGAWTHPLPGASVTGEYGEPRGGYLHVGLDLSTIGGTGPGSYVRAPANMLVTISREDGTGGLPDAGSYVKGHTTSGDAYSFSFFHMYPGSLRVAVGQTIAAGAIIGIEGNSGNSYGTHLHFEVWPGHMQGDFFYWGDGTPPNPEPIMNSKGVYLR